MRQHQPTLLLTGASGVLGHALIDELCQDFRVICLRGRRRLGDPRVTELEGELRHPRLGLDVVAYANLIRRVDVVVHGAAMTKWTADPGQLTAINVGGTKTMLQVATDASAPLYYLSTAFVRRAPSTDPRFAGQTAYLHSKIEAERLLSQSGTDTVIVRPSVIIGDARDGRMSAFQGLHRMLGAIITGTMPVLPADTGALVDAVPQDVVAEAIGTLIRSGVVQGEFWLTAGAGALTFGDYVDLGGVMSRDLGILAHPPRFVPFEAVDRLLLPLLDDLLDAGQKQLFIDLLESVSMFQEGGELPTDLPALGLGHRVTRRALTDATHRSMMFWARSKGLTGSALADTMKPRTDPPDEPFTQAVS